MRERSVQGGGSQDNSLEEDKLEAMSISEGEADGSGPMLFSEGDKREML